MSYGGGYNPSAPPPPSQGYGQPPSQGYAQPQPSQGYQQPQASHGYQPQGSQGYQQQQSNHHGSHAPPPQQPAPQHSASQQQSQGYAGHNPQLRGWFDSVDSDRSGSIDCLELQRALSNSGFRFGEEASRLMIRMFDRAHKGGVNFEEFLQLHQYLSTMQQAFLQCDSDRSGTLQANEVYNALTSSGYSLSQDTFNGMMRKFDRHNRGSLTLDGYIELCVFIGTVRNTYAYFDQQRVGNVNFNFDMFARASTFITP